MTVASQEERVLRLGPATVIIEVVVRGPERDRYINLKQRLTNGIRFLDKSEIHVGEPRLGAGERRFKRRVFGKAGT